MEGAKNPYVAHAKAPLNSWSHSGMNEKYLLLCKVTEVWGLFDTGASIEYFLFATLLL